MKFPPRDATAADLLGDLIASRRLRIPVWSINTTVTVEQFEPNPEEIWFEIEGREAGFRASSLNAGGVQFRVTDPHAFRVEISTLLAAIDEAERHGYFEAIRADHAAGEAS